MTFKFSVEVHDEEFSDWLKYVKNEFLTMVQTMIDVAHVVELHSRKYVPIETGRLEFSYKFVVEEKTSNFIEVGVSYDAIDPDSGFHYAEYQHNQFLRHKDRENADFDLSFRYRAYYLSNGIRDAEQQSFELIEKDYLSLFKGV